MGLEWRLKGSVCLERGKDDIQDPQRHENGGGDIFEDDISAQLSPDFAIAEKGNEPSGKDDGDGDAGTDDVDHHGECQGSGFYLECGAICSMVDSGNDPGDSETEEDVDRVTSSDVADSVVSIFLIDSSGLTGEGVGQRGSQRNEGDRGHFVL